MVTPPYFKQDRPKTCSLAVLRMVLANFGQNVSESELLKKVEGDYGHDFHNIWNPTIAKIALDYGIKTTISANWPILKPEVLAHAMHDYFAIPEKFNYKIFENSKDGDKLSEPLPLAYKELFLAVQKGCVSMFGGISKDEIYDSLSKGKLIQTSIKLERMYPGSKNSFHSILVYAVSGDEVSFHDPAKGEGMSCSVDHLIDSAMDVGAFMTYSK